jgi:antitoxin PrlF
LEQLGVEPGDQTEVDLLRADSVRIRAESSRPISSIFGIMSGRTVRVMTLEEINEAAASGWSGERRRSFRFRWSARGGIQSIRCSAGGPESGDIFDGEVSPGLADTGLPTVGARTAKAGLLSLAVMGGPTSMRSAVNTGEGRSAPARPPATPANREAAGFPRSRSHPISAIQSQTSSGPANMPSKPNYKYQRAERDRAKKASKDTKLQERKEQAALRKANEPNGADPREDSVQGSEE